MRWVEEAGRVKAPTLFMFPAPGQNITSGNGNWYWALTVTFLPGTLSELVDGGQAVLLLKHVSMGLQVVVWPLEVTRERFTW
jgi:hypothetical protein